MRLFLEILKRLSLRIPSKICGKVPFTHDLVVGGRKKVSQVRTYGFVHLYFTFRGALLFRWILGRKTNPVNSMGYVNIIIIKENV